MERRLIALVFALLAPAYALATPVFEKNDEQYHFAFARQLALSRGLPVQAPGSATSWEQEGSQPPLYYMLAAPLVALFDTSDFDLQTQPNASPQYAPFFPGNKNKLLITEQKVAPGYARSTLAAMVVRLFTVLAGLATVLLVFKLCDALGASRRDSALAGAFVAFNPMFLTVSSAVSNDALTIALTTAGLCEIAVLARDGPSPLRALRAGVIVALASLTKLSGLALLPILGMTLLMPARAGSSRAMSLRARWQPFLIYGAVWLALAGWWYARNVMLYGELTGSAMMARIAGPRLSAFDPVGEFRALRWTFLGIFGQTNVPLDIVVYQIADVVTAIAAFGLGVWAVRAFRAVIQRRSRWISSPGIPRRPAGAMHDPSGKLGAGSSAAPPDDMRAPLLLTAHLAAIVLGMLGWTQLTAASHGRLLFPAIATIAMGGVIGLRTALAVARLPARLAIGPAMGLLLLALAAPLWSILPAYRAPLIARSDAPALQGFGDGTAELVSVSITPASALPGSTVRVDAVLRALRPTKTPYLLAIKLYGQREQLLARFDTYTGGGLYPSDVWRPGAQWRESALLTLPLNSAAPARLRAQFELFNPATGDKLLNRDAAGMPGAPLFGDAVLAPTARDARAARAQFGAFADLLDARAESAADGASLTLTLVWRARAAADKDYTLLVHAYDGAGALTGQADGPPAGGDFPTSRWVAGAVFTETRQLPWPSAAASAHIGFYDPDGFARQPVRGAAADAMRDDALRIFTRR